MAKLQSKVTIWVAFAVLAAVAAALFWWGPGDRFRSAWAFASPPLTGHWQGTIETPTGKRFPIFLTLTYRDPNRGRRLGRRSSRQRGYGSFEGQAIVCDTPGKAAAYNIDGSPEDRR